MPQHGLPSVTVMLFHSMLALLAGAAIAVQAALNSSLGKLLGSPLYATVVAFGTGFVFAGIAALVFARGADNATSNAECNRIAMQHVPLYLWFAGGLIGALALVSFYWLIPHIGIGTTLSFALTGQLVLALIAGHFGWFGLPQTPMSAMRFSGAATLLLGMVLIHKG
jgi:bacterial/archaeal transporter family-2 protein